jgi:hypothetical protein
MAGQRFGRLVVVADRDAAGDLLGSPENRLVDVVCDCGVEKRVAGRGLRKGHTTSCGCARLDAITTHGLSRTSLYSVWSGMMARCYRESTDSFHRYGARGISVCAEWRSDPAEFVRWSESNGWGRGKHIDRIDNDGDYTPENCRFVDAVTNQNNKSSNVHITPFGRRMTLAQAANEFGVPYDVLIQRVVKLQWDHDRAVTQPTRPMARRAAA